MKYISTRGKAGSHYVSQAMLKGLASDGGLFVPERFPIFQSSDFNKCHSILDVGLKLLTPFFKGDPLQKELKDILTQSLDFPILLTHIEKGTSILELYHGPTAAFKDIGARFLAACYKHLKTTEKKTILVATSGDTGGAVASAFESHLNTKVILLFPKDGVSEFQKRQLTCWKDNILSLQVNGNFDDCQKLVKDAFREKALVDKIHLTSANSINIGRLLPQMIYYSYASLIYYRKFKAMPGFVIPAGNLGNAVAAFWVKQMGFPIRHIALACNDNKPIYEFYQLGKFQPRPAIATLANAMDVGSPSNMERLLYLYPKMEKLMSDSSCASIDDKTIKEVIEKDSKYKNIIWCPHTATAVAFRDQKKDPHWIIVATAHPSKFASSIEPLTQKKVPLSTPLKSILTRPTHFTEIDVSLESLLKFVL